MKSWMASFLTVALATFGVAGLDRPASAQTPTPCPAGAHLEVEWNGTWYASTIMAGPNEAGQCQIHYDGWDSTWDEWVGNDRMRGLAPPAQACPAGEGREVLWGDKWYAATIMAGPNDTSQCQIHYDGWDSSHDEWVGADRMRGGTPMCTAGRAIEVEWNGTWYPSTVVSGTDGACLIHYTGWDDSWNETVAMNRMRLAQ